jgi:succinate dehydrogenase / fumarate reductase flavoprotein subunit
MAISETPKESAESNPPVAFEQISVPVLVVGAGAAGARAAIALKQNGVNPLVIGKRDYGDAHTTWAAGGVNASLGSLDEEDDWAIHAADTIAEGHYLNDPTAVEVVTRSMPDRVREMDDWGMEFDRAKNGNINQRFFGAQSFRRTCFVGDRTGEAMLDTLVSKAQSLDIAYRENVMVTRLLYENGSVSGAVGFDMESGELLLFKSNNVILATGGFPSVYNRHTSREEENNGDGLFLALRAGAVVQDMEFVQFHPTGIVTDDEDWSGRLVTEAVRGEGGRLFNADGERFMERYSPTSMELDARDIVARAIAQEVAEGRGTEEGGVYLDISHRDDEFIRERLPRMVDRADELGIDLTKEPFRVGPTAHYGMGGLQIDFETGETAVDGLYAIGEVTAGVHGANRLGGNSLAETLALGKVVGDAIATDEPTQPEGELNDVITAQSHAEFTRLNTLSASTGGNDPEEILDELGEIMWEHAGISRTEDSLREGLERLDTLESEAEQLAVDGGRTSRSFEFAIDVEFMLFASRLIMESALRRPESRGAHHREDHPEKDEAQQHNLVSTWLPETGLSFDTDPVGEIDDEIQTALDADYELDYHQLE